VIETEEKEKVMLRRVSYVGLIALSVSLAGSAALAQVARVFVSVNGNDGNICSNVATPCRTFGGGITQVDPGGEVIVLDTGSYGGTTVGKAVTINVPPGVVAFAAQPFTINAGASDVVTLRGITLKALTPGSGTGISYTQAAALHLENCVINGWSTGILLNALANHLIITDSIVKGCTSVGLEVLSGGSASISRTRFEGNSGIGMYVFANGSSASARDCVFAGNGTGVKAEVGVSTAFVDLESCLISDNTTGVVSFASGGGNASVRISNCVITRNGTGTDSSGGTGGNIQTRTNNTIRDNTADSTGTVNTYFAN
jgi:hypothetical protein